MKAIIFLSALLGVISFNVVLTTPLLGAKECTWGPSYWCKNITNAKNCNAVHHCIQTVWEKQEVPEDNDSICQICKDMVKQARDQLRSNETMEELREVFEGSCKLIPIKIAKKECIRLADDFIPELVEALSAQMNPDQVCTVAGLCNNAEYDRKLTAYYAAALDGSLGQLNCNNCHSVSDLITKKFATTDRDEILENILHLCGEMSSFSDACSNIVLTYFNDMYEHLQVNLKSSSICHLSGVCASRYHVHADEENEINDDEDYDMIDNDDIPCELCEQLIRHLRDVLIANTTEAEFKQVLEGLCKQTKGFKSECLSIVDQYYDVVYNTLVNNLNESGACFLIGVCPKGVDTYKKAEIRPLLPALPPADIKVNIRKKLGANEPKFTQNELLSMVLPIDKLMGAQNPSQLVDGGELCTFCEYLLHFIQDELATPATEDEIKKKVENICNKFSTSLRGECHNFVDMYGDAVIALLIQGLNPRDVCPKLQMCPQNLENNDMEVFSPKPIAVESDESDKPTCPMCLFAVEEAKQKIKDNKSKEHIKDVLDHLCNHLPTKLQAECADFVNTYSNELIDKLISDLNSQEICVSIKLCPNPSNYVDQLGLSLADSNEEEDNDDDDLPVEIEFVMDDEMAPAECLLCKEVMKIVEKEVSKKTSKAEIVDVLEHACDKIKRKLNKKCHKVIDPAANKIADLILSKTSPTKICSLVALCLWSEQEDLDFGDNLKYDVIYTSSNAIQKSERIVGLDDITIKDPPNCVLCEFIMTKLEIELKNKTEQDEIKRTIEHICKVMPKSVSKSCNKFIDQYANTIFVLIGTTPPKEICKAIQLCADSLPEAVTDEVIECGICHGASMYLLPYFKQHLDTAVIAAQDMVTIACENLPAKYYTICTEMITIYGPSILHLSEKDAINESQICTEIGKCYSSERSGLAFARISA